VDVVGFTTRALRERRTIRFDARMKGGPVALRKRLDGASKGPVERRPLFSEVAVKGELSLAPFPAGRVITSLGGLELGAFEGEAKKEGVDLKDGVVDLDSDVFLTDVGDLRSKTDVVVNSLDLKELDNGPLRKSLALPVPLEAALFAVRDEDGSIELALPLELAQWVKLTRQELNDQLRETILHAISVVLGNAVKAAPLRVVQVGESGPKPVEEPPIVIDFAPGDIAIADSAAGPLAQLAQRLRDDPERKLQVTLRHDAGGGDLKRARVATNPSPNDRRDLISRLRARRDALLRARQDATAEARAAAVAGLESDALAVRRTVQATDLEPARVERSLDELYDLEGEGAERQAERRARQGCIELASARLEGVRALLGAQGVAREDDRIHLASPRVEDVPGAAGGRVSLTVRVRKSK